MCRCISKSDTPTRVIAGSMKHGAVVGMVTDGACVPARHGVFSGDSRCQPDTRARTLVMDQYQLHLEILVF